MVRYHKNAHNVKKNEKNLCKYRIHLHGTLSLLASYKWDVLKKSNKTPQKSSKLKIIVHLVIRSLKAISTQNLNLEKKVGRKWVNSH